MNAILNGAQSNTRKGEINLPSTADMTGKENLLLRIVNTAGAPNFALPAAVTDMAIYICMSGDVAANLTAAEVPNTGENCRVLVNGAVNPGDKLCIDPGLSGKLYAPAGGAGALTVHFIAEEAAAAGGLCLVRKVGPFPFTF